MIETTRCERCGAVTGEFDTVQKRWLLQRGEQQCTGCLAATGSLEARVRHSGISPDMWNADGLKSLKQLSPLALPVELALLTWFQQGGPLLIWGVERRELEQLAELVTLSLLELGRDVHLLREAQFAEHPSRLNDESLMGAARPQLYHRISSLVFLGLGTRTYNPFLLTCLWQLMESRRQLNTLWISDQSPSALVRWVEELRPRHARQPPSEVRLIAATLREWVKQQRTVLLLELGDPGAIEDSTPAMPRSATPSDQG